MAKSKSKKLAVFVAPGPPEKPGKKKKNRKRKTKAKAGQLVGASLDYLAMMADPWTSAPAARPDYNRKRVLPWREHHVKTITPDAAGNFLICIRPQLFEMVQVATLCTVAGTPATYAVGDLVSSAYESVTQYTNIAAFATYQRPHAITANAYYMGKSDSSKGLLGVCTVDAIDMSAKVNYSTFIDEEDFDEAPVDEGVEGVCRYFDTNFVLMNTGPGQDLSYIYVMGTGLDPTQQIRLELDWIGEVICGPQSLQTRSAEIPITHPPQIHAAANIIGPETSTAHGPGRRDKLRKAAKRQAKFGAFLNGLENAAQFAATVAAIL